MTIQTQIKPVDIEAKRQDIDKMDSRILDFTFKAFELANINIEHIPQDLVNSDELKKLYDPYAKSIKESNKLGSEWVETLYPNISSLITSELIEAASTNLFFTAYLKEIIEPIEKDPSKKLTEVEIKRCIELLTNLKQLMQSKIAKFEAYYKSEIIKDKIIESGLLYDYRKRLDQEASWIKARILEMKKEESEFEYQIDQLKKQRQKANEIADYARKVVIGTGVGVGISATVVLFPIVGQIIAVPALIGTAIPLGIYDKQLREAEAQIQELTDKINANGKVFDSMHNYTDSTDTAQSKLNDMILSFTDITKIWNDIINPLDKILDELQKIKPEDNIQFMETVWSDKANKDWTDLQDFARHLQLRPILKQSTTNPYIKV